MPVDGYCLVIPHYRHEVPLADMLGQLVAFGLPIYVVDDASGADALEVLRPAVAAYADADPTTPARVTLIERQENGGKGAAMMTGLLAAHQAGYTHALSVDADGQHDLADVGAMLDLSQHNPHVLITGRPVFGEDIPASRLHGRKLTNGLVKLQAGRLDFPDAMCGFRVYPLGRVVPLFAAIGYRTRMEFDVEILVRAAWADIPVTSLDTRVRYPLDGRSHFNMVADNVRLTAMHILLLLGSLLRLPRRLLGRAATREVPDAKA